MKIKLTLRLILILIALLSITTGNSAETEIKPSRKIDRVIIPFVVYSSETGFVVGLAGSVSTNSLFRADDSFSILTSNQYTQKKQSNINLMPRYQFADNYFQTDMDLGYKYWPSEFYGIGINSEEDDLEEYTSREFDIEWTLRRRVYQNWSIGWQLKYAAYNLKIGDEAPLLSSGVVPGSAGGNVAGSGLTLTYDRRNSQFFATDGAFYELRALLHSPGMESDYSFNQYSLDIRQFYPLSDRETVTFQFFTGYQTRSVPFQEMFSLGDFLRAYQSSRYIDRSITIARSEYKVFPFSGRLTGRLGFVLFAETGTVSDGYSKWKIEDNKISAGGGLRFRLIEGEGIVLRADAGFAPDSFNLIFIALEAF